ncbi:MAG: phospho-sugar mutase [Phycisphaerae bacterium]
MLDAPVRAAMERWLQDPAIAEPDKQEIRALQERADDAELTDRFYRTLAFGTGGLRGTIGAGLNRMNLYTVGAAAQGLANYIARHGDAARRAGVAIAFDCRRMSDVFAARVACVMAANGITAYLFDRLRPTPELSFAVRHLGCTAGVVITASHNPPEYNGFKAYWTDGGQVVPPHDQRIIEEVGRVGGFENIRAMPEQEARSKGLIRPIGRDIDEPFLDAVQATCLNPQVCREQGRKLRIVYTPLHGTGGGLIPEALRRRGLEQVITVPEQSEPDGEFPTVASPNPEEAAALAMGIDLARREEADVVIGTDPDADRVGLAVRGRDGVFVLVSGNRIGALLAAYICEQLKQAGRFPENGVVLSTIVSSDFMKEIARSYGAEVVETLTGFKWIGRKLHEYDLAGTPDAPAKSFIFGAEESYGYLPAALARDKDAVTSAAFIAELAAFAASRGRSILDELDALFRRYGYFQEGAKSFVMKGPTGAARIAALMNDLRNAPPSRIGGCDVVAIADWMTGEDRDAQTGEVLRRYDLPKSDVVQFTLSDGTKVIARPSGTEPKIKFYILVRGPGDDPVRAAASATRHIERITADLVTRVEAAGP